MDEYEMARACIYRSFAFEGERFFRPALSALEPVYKVPK
jgi:hypothetical protein